jgi:uncharacterized repeat protein (TIGR03803 family)
MAMATASPAQTFSTLASFNNTDGANPFYISLVQGSNGDLYGTTELGGANGDGTVFKITTAGKLTTLHSFDYSDGAGPYAGVVLASDGNLYGTTTFGGAYGDGTVFKITTGGTLTTLYSFCSQSGCTDGYMPYAGLVQGKDGDLYGTTFLGGSNAFGTIFKITTKGALTTLYSFCSQTLCADGYLPFAGLIQANDSHLYGTTTLGGSYGEGTVFKITTAGKLTTLHSFNTTDGAEPDAGLVQAGNGALYGTTPFGGAFVDYGTIFKITTSGTLTTLHSFDGLDGGSPYARLTQASDKNLYGTALFGKYGVGTVFKITTAGTFSTEHSFDYTDGIWPYGGLFQGSNGDLYGTTSQGASGYGTVFSLSLPGKNPDYADEPEKIQE